MGETRVHLTIYGTDDKVAELEALVDTGVAFSKIPEHLASSLGLQEKPKRLDGTTKRRGRK